jgi:hypothetical protein
LAIQSKEKVVKEQMVPVLFFPSKDGKIYSMFSKGNQIFGNLKS